MPLDLDAAAFCLAGIQSELETTVGYLGNGYTLPLDLIGSHIEGRTTISQHELRADLKAVQFIRGDRVRYRHTHSVNQSITIEVADLRWNQRVGPAKSEALSERSIHSGVVAGGISQSKLIGISGVIARK